MPTPTVRKGCSSVMRFEEVPTPEPGPGEVLIKVHAVSVNRTLDTRVRAGTYARPVTLPLVPFMLSSGPAKADHPPPQLGGHTDEVLRGLGYTAEQCEQLRFRGVI